MNETPTVIFKSCLTHLEKKPIQFMWNHKRPLIAKAINLKEQKPCWGYYNT